jgi:acyl phosphate:glycerol-3-phosphate acyltransferase
MIQAVAIISIAYLLGSLSGSLLLGRLRGVDIRTLGSGNAGGTNALRTQGPLFAIGVAVIDVGKGAGAAVLASWLLSDNVPMALAAVFAAVIGHIWPVFHDFRGGKGAATLVGGLLIVWPQALAPLLAVWFLCLLLTGYVGLSTVLAALSLLFSAYWFKVDAGFCLFAAASAALLAYSHRSNLRRLRAGTEPRFEKVRILGRLFSGSRG